jgi:predicted ATPase
LQQTHLGYPHIGYLIIQSRDSRELALDVDINHFLPGHFSSDPSDKNEFSTYIKKFDTTQILIDEFSRLIRYLGPLRADPSTIHTSPTGEPDDVGKQGEHAAAVYEARKLLTVRWVPPGESESRENTLEEAMAAWLVYLGMAKGVASQEAARGFTWMVKTHGDKARPLFSVGVGVSQVLPILVAGLLAPEGAVLIIEQPELHLHPRAQARLGDFFVSLAHLGKQCLIETHSDTLVNQLRLHMVKGGEAVRELVSIYFVEQDEQGDARFEPVKVSEGGNIVNWPEGFLDESVKQEEAIAQEALRRRASRSRSSA